MCGKDNPIKSHDNYTNEERKFTECSRLSIEEHKNQLNQYRTGAHNEKYRSKNEKQLQRCKQFRRKVSGTSNKPLKAWNYAYLYRYEITDELQV